MTQTAAKTQLETEAKPDVGEDLRTEMPFEDSREWQAERLRLLWDHRRFFFRAGAIGLIASSVLRLLDSQTLHLDCAAHAAGCAVFFGRGDDGRAGSKVKAAWRRWPGDLLGVKSSGCAVHRGAEKPNCRRNA